MYKSGCLLFAVRIYLVNEKNTSHILPGALHRRNERGEEVLELLNETGPKQGTQTLGLCATQVFDLCSRRISVLWGKRGPKSVVDHIGKLGVGCRRDGWDLIDCLRTEIVPEHILSRRAK